MLLKKAALATILFTGICGVASALDDVTVPSDPIVRVDGSNDGDFDSGLPPAGEDEQNSIDDTTNKYLNFQDINSGIIVTPSIGSTVLTGLRLYTANDFEGRDPASYVLEGSNAGASGPFSIISQGLLTLPSGRNSSGSPIPDLSLNHQELSFSNTASYTTYRLTFPTLKDAGGNNSMQIGEIELLGVQSQPLSAEPVDVPTIGYIGLFFLSGIVGLVAIRRHNRTQQA